MRRREVLGGLVFGGAAVQASRGWAEPGDPPTAPFLAKSSLKDNPIAAKFSVPPQAMRINPIRIVGAKGEETLRLPKGITLVSLWAPWCAPCLTEIADFAPLQKSHGGGAFNIMPLLGNPMSQAANAQAAQVLAKSGGEVFRPLVIHDFITSPAYKAANRPGVGKTGFSLPCNLLVASDGRVLARSFGAPPKNAPKPGTVTMTKDEAMAKGFKMASGPGHTIWSTDAGRQFVAAFASGEFVKV